MIRIINNDDEYNEAMRCLSNLLDIKEHTPEEENDLQLLLLVIKSYEESKLTRSVVDPIEAIKFRMDQMGYSRKDLTLYIGSMSKVSEVLNGKRTLSLNMIRNLHNGLGIPLKSLIGIDKQESVNSIVDFSLFPLKEMAKRGYFGEANKNLANIQDYAQELISKFCGKYSFLLKRNFALCRAPMHQRGNREINKYNLIVWQICVLKKAELLKSKTPKYNKEKVNLNWLRELMMLSRFSNGHILAKEYLAKAGIVLIIESHFPKTFLDGAAILFEGIPIIALTLRHKRVDNFWFVLAHELAHLIKHMGEQDDTSFFIDDLSVSNQLDDLEKEADEIANEALIPEKNWDISVLKFRSYKQIDEFAKKVQVNPAIIAGRIRHLKNDYKIFNNYFKPEDFSQI